jgi:hypothetical protein
VFEDGGEVVLAEAAVDRGVPECAVDLAGAEQFRGGDRAGHLHPNPAGVRGGGLGQPQPRPIAEGEEVGLRLASWLGSSPPLIPRPGRAAATGPPSTDLPVADSAAQIPGEEAASVDGAAADGAIPLAVYGDSAYGTGEFLDRLETAGAQSRCRPPTAAVGRLTKDDSAST